MNTKNELVENKTSVMNDTTPRVANSHKRMFPAIRNDRRNSEIWSELKKDFLRIGVPDHAIDSLALIPLVETALDDGIISLSEKTKILFVMKNVRLVTMGIDPILSDMWKSFEGRTTFLIVWTVYLRDLSMPMRPKEKKMCEALIIESCRFMTRIMEGFLKVPDFEERILVAIENAYAFETVSFRG